MSRITCLSIFSGSSALSTRSLRLARMRVETRSMRAMTYLLRFRLNWRLDGNLRRVGSDGLGRLVADRAGVGEQLLQIHPAERLEEGRDLRRHPGHVAGDLVDAGGIAVAC